MPNLGKNLTLWLVIVVIVFVLFSVFKGSLDTSSDEKITFSEFMMKVDQGEIADVTIRQSEEKGTIISGHYMQGSARFITQAPDYPDLVDKLRSKGVKISAAPASTGLDNFWGALLSWFPILLLIGVYIFVMRQMQQGGGRGGAMGFGKSRARLLNENTQRITFEDVAGIDEAKDELQEIVEFLKDPGKFQRLGGRIPRGCLLVGPPGTGKTLLARAIAGEAGVPFFTISGSDFVEMFVGVGASRVRDMFEQGKKNAPCIVFIDEIDAVGRHRGGGMGGSNDEREQTLNQLLVEMDGFDPNDSVIIIAATNRPDVLDAALLRPGRFDRQITVPNPDVQGREKILKVHLKKVPQGPDVDPMIIARGTPGFSGADLANLINEAALLAARRGKKVVTMKELENAKDKVMMGAERRSMVMSDQEKKMTAYHEAGHAIVGLHTPGSDPIHKATIIPRGRALGMVMHLPEADKISFLRDMMHSKLAVYMGGRIAEELIFGHDKVSSGASGDIQGATRIARAMVAEWGMSDKIGPIYYGGGQGDTGGFYAPQRPFSEQMAAEIDAEVHRIIDESYQLAKKILVDNIDSLHTLAKALLEYETLTGDEINALLRGEKIVRVDETASAKSSGKSALPSSRRGNGKDKSEISETAEGDGNPPANGENGPEARQ